MIKGLMVNGKSRSIIKTKIIKKTANMKKTSKAIEDYLEALLMLEEKKTLLDISSVAALLKVSMPAASQMMSELKKRGLIEKQPYGDIFFTDKGRKIAKEVYHRHKILWKYLVSIGVSSETAEQDCCQIEHVISSETFQAFEKLILAEEKNKL
jgi:DtxR family transcriptional regulator, Mn-dependent transcriptional regulator